MALEDYRKKRRFDRTPEPSGEESSIAGGRFVVQMHAARRLHYDLRLEIGGTLKSWAVPKGPSLNPADKRLAARTEDHPVEYLSFEEVIPEGQYGAGTMMVWDSGTFRVEGDGDAEAQIERGDLKFTLFGRKLRGSFALVRTQKASKRDRKSEDWLLIKHRDAAVDEEWDVEALPESALSGRTIDEVRDGAPPRPSAAAAAAVDGSEPGEPPAELRAMLAESAEAPFSHPDWLFELKWDGVRTQARVDEGELRLISRNGRDVTSHYPELAELPLRLRVPRAVLDGEIVALDERGRADFGRLQSRMHVEKPAPILVERTPVVYYVFDVPFADGRDLRRAPLVERKRCLREILVDGPSIRYSDRIEENGEALFDLAREHGAEGIVAKRAESGYVSARSSDWLKIKVVQEIDCVVGGFTEPRGGRDHLGALLLGLYRGDELRFVGGVGTGFDAETLAALEAALRPLIVRRGAFAETPKTKEKAYWVRPRLIARVRFGSWTKDRILRHPVFLGLRDDIEPNECVDPIYREAGAAKSAPQLVYAPAVDTVPRLSSLDELEDELTRGTRETVKIEIGGKAVRLTHLDRVYFPQPGYTKRRLLAYYLQVADRILPFLRERPLVLHRFPNGIEGEAFYQKDCGEGVPEWMDTVVIPSESTQRDIRYFVCNDLAALLHLVNLGSIEHHPWPSRVGDLETPDYVFFDLDPTEGASYDTVVAVAREILGILEEAELKAFLKTSGSKGMHLWLPLVREYDFEQSRAFAEIVARVIHSRMPRETTLERMVDRRPPGAIYLDYSQNAYGRPLATVYCVRPRPLATVSTPLRKTELRKGLRPEKFTIETVPKRLARRGDLWAEFEQSRRRIDEALERLARMFG